MLFLTKMSNRVWPFDSCAIFLSKLRLKRFRKFQYFLLQIRRFCDPGFDRTCMVITKTSKISSHFNFSMVGVAHSNSWEKSGVYISITILVRSHCKDHFNSTGRRNLFKHKCKMCVDFTFSWRDVTRCDQ